MLEDFHLWQTLKKSLRPFVLWEENLSRDGHFIALSFGGLLRFWFKERWLQFEITARNKWMHRKCAAMQAEIEQQWLWAKLRQSEVQRDIEAGIMVGGEWAKHKGCRKDEEKQLWGSLQNNKCWKAHWILGEDTLTGEWDLFKYIHLCWSVLFPLKVPEKYDWGRASVLGERMAGEEWRRGKGEKRYMYNFKSALVVLPRK